MVNILLTDFFKVFSLNILLKLCLLDCNLIALAALVISWLCKEVIGNLVKNSNFPGGGLPVVCDKTSSPIEVVNLQSHFCFLICNSSFLIFWAIVCLFFLVSFWIGYSGKIYNLRTTNKTGQSSFFVGPLSRVFILLRDAWFNISFASSYWRFLFTL